jgi:SAM-dependent methyltransferase
MTDAIADKASADDAAARFEAMFNADADPWRYRSRWYEERKRALTLACLPQPVYASGFEPACANGELAAALATRCERLLASDGAAAAVAVARRRLAGLPHVEVRQAWLPQQWPAQTFELIVLSEFGYYLPREQLERVAAQARASLRPGGTILACHWRRPIAGCALSGDEVQQCIGGVLQLPVLGHCIDADLRIDVWSSHAGSVAQREGFI